MTDLNDQRFSGPEAQTANLRKEFFSVQYELKPLLCRSITVKTWTLLIPVFAFAWNNESNDILSFIEQYKVCANLSSQRRPIHAWTLGSAPLNPHLWMGWALPTMCRDIQRKATKGNLKSPLISQLHINLDSPHMDLTASSKIAKLIVGLTWSVVGTSAAC